MIPLRTALVCALLAVAPAAHAGTGTAAPDSSELARRIDELARQIADLQSRPGSAPPQSQHGFGPAASKVYGTGSGVSIGGYGEIVLEGTEKSAASDTSSDEDARGTRADLERQIVYVGYKFDDRLLFNSEIEFEHASTERHGAVSVEFAYFDALLHPAVNARA